MKECKTCKHEHLSSVTEPCKSCDSFCSKYESDTITTQISTASPSIGFICTICHNNQEIDTFFKPVFPVCDNCIKDLGDIINERRKK